MGRSSPSALSVLLTQHSPRHSRATDLPQPAEAEPLSGLPRAGEVLWAYHGPRPGVGEARGTSGAHLQACGSRTDRRLLLPEPGPRGAR